VLKDACLFKASSHDLSASLFPPLPYIFYTPIEDGLFLKSKRLLGSIPFHSTNKAATLPFSIMEEKSSFYSTIFITQKKQRKTIYSHKKSL
jgi:hypothetical protein